MGAQQISAKQRRFLYTFHVELEQNKKLLQNTWEMFSEGMSSHFHLKCTNTARRVE
jgi:hypothetical protein